MRVAGNLEYVYLADDIQSLVILLHLKLMPKKRTYLKKYIQSYHKKKIEIPQAILPRNQPNQVTPKRRYLKIRDTSSYLTQQSAQSSNSQKKIQRY